MRISKAAVADYTQIEREFFEIDEEKGNAIVRLHYSAPDDIFDGNCMSRTPLFNDDFDDWLRTAFDMIPSKYRIVLKISFDDLNGYSSEQLREAFRKNFLLSAKSHVQAVKARNRIAYRLMAVGLLSFIAMLLISRLWVTENIWHEVFFYFLDIVTTVLFWEAAGILFVENREHRAASRGYRERFTSIEFECAHRQSQL